MAAPLFAFDNGVIVWMFYAWIAASVVWFIRNAIHNRGVKTATRVAEADATSEKAREQKYIDAEPAVVAPRALDLRSAAPAPKLLATTPTGTTQTSSVRVPADASTVSESNSTPSRASTPAQTSVPPRDPAAPAPPERTRSIAELLTGIRLPSGLLPIVPHGEPASDQRVALLSAQAQPMEIGVALADELERLRYEIATMSTDQAVATRGLDVLSLRIHSNAELLENDTGLLFPNAAPESVVVELWVGDSANQRDA